MDLNTLSLEGLLPSESIYLETLIDSVWRTVYLGRLLALVETSQAF